MRNLSIVNKELYQLLIRSAIAYVICVVICGWYIKDVYGIYGDTITKKHIQNVEQTEELTYAYFADLDRTMTLSANEMARVSGGSAAKYKDVLTRITNMGTFSQVIYVTVDNQIYTKEGIDNSDELKESWRLIQESRLDKPHPMLDVPQVGDKMIVFPRKVIADGEALGYLVAFYDPADLFELPIYNTMRSTSQCYMIMEGGLILDQADHENISNTRLDSDNFFTQMYAFSDGNGSSKKKLQEMKAHLLDDVDKEFTIKATMNDSHICQVNSKVIVPVDNMYLVTIVDRTVQMGGVTPFLHKSLLILIIIFGILVIVNATTIVYLRKVTSRIEKLAYTDEVTKGKNLNFFTKEAMILLEVNQELPYIIQRFDIANFRYLNEAYGHLRADEILKACIDIYQEIYSERELCVRMDSDQFLTLTINDNDVAERRKQYCERLNEYAQQGGITYPIQLRFGIYQIRKQDREIDVMIDRANVARKSIAESKTETIAYYTDSLMHDMRKLDKIESDMQNALETGEFKVFLQAKWDIVNDHVAGAEALVRWIKPDGNMVFPDEFIPVFEQNGFIEKLDFYMLETVCKRMEQVLKDGGTIYPVSVNQSRVLLHSPDYVDRIQGIFDKYQIPRQCVELEVTETSLADSREHMIGVLKQLKQEEVQLAMDDFGSGYSSLNLLKDMPFDVLKIDREFFSESLTSESSTLILQKIIEMADGLGMEVICEGVENEKQVELLRKIGCKRVQGYYYARPVPMEEYVKKYCQVAE